MSGEIKITRAPVEEGITELRSSIQALETTFSKEITGDSKLDMVTAFNEIKQEYDELLTQFEALFLKNVDSTEEAVANIQETEREVASNIRLMK